MATGSGVVFLETTFPKPDTSGINNGGTDRPGQWAMELVFTGLVLEIQRRYLQELAHELRKSICDKGVIKL